MNQELMFPKSFPKSLAVVAGHGNEARIKKYFDRSVPVILEAIASGEILSTQMTDLRSDVNRIIDEVIKIAINEKYTWSGKFENLSEELRDLSWSLPGDARSLNAFIKRLNKLSAEGKKHAMYEDACTIAMELFPFYQFIEWSKTHTVKASERRKELAEEKVKARDEYVKQLVEHEDMKKVLALLEKTAEEIKAELFKSRLMVYQSVVERFKQAVKAGDSDYTKIFERDVIARIMLQSLVERTDDVKVIRRPSDPKKFALIKDYTKKMEELAMREAMEILNHFTYKNTNKLSVILTTKNNLASVEIKNVTLGRGVVECDVHCVFKDSSEFTANNKVVFSYSKLGKPFYRFPTTFRNVILQNGEKMGQPSEERMDKVFAVAK